MCDAFSINSFPTVNTVVSDIYPVLHNAEILLASPSALSDELRGVLHKVFMLDKEYSKWLLRQPDAWRSKRLKSEIGPTMSSPSWWPRNVDIYFDRNDPLLNCGHPLTKK